MDGPIASTVGAALASANIKTDGHDLVSPATTAALADNSTITVKYGRPVSVTVNGPLSLSAVDLVAVSVSDPGTAATGGVTASLALPAGLRLLGPGSGSPGWSCSGSTCTHGPIAAGADATVSFRILVASLVSCGDPVPASAVSAGLSATGQSAGRGSSPARIFSTTIHAPGAASARRRRYPRGSARPSGWSMRKPSSTPSA